MPATSWKRRQFNDIFIFLNRCRRGGFHIRPRNESPTHPTVGANGIRPRMFAAMHEQGRGHSDAF